MTKSNKVKTATIKGIITAELVNFELSSLISRKSKPIAVKLKIIVLIFKKILLQETILEPILLIQSLIWLCLISAFNLASR